MPFFSVVIPSFNRAHVLPKVVAAVLGQKFADLELIIVDDGSTDNTEAVVATFTDSRIQYIRQHNAGVCAARNRGIQQATAGWITFVDSDDSVTENWLADFYDAIQTGNADMIVCRRVTVTNPTTAVHTFLPGSFAIKTNVLKQIGGYDEDIRYGENTELKWRFQQQGFQLRHIDAVNLLYDDTSTGGSKNKKNQVDFFYHVRRKHAALFARDRGLSQNFHQIAGVNSFRIGQTKQAIHLLWQGYKLRPTNLKAFAKVLWYALQSIAK